MKGTFLSLQTLSLLSAFSDLILAIPDRRRWASSATIPIGPSVLSFSSDSVYSNRLCSSDTPSLWLSSGFCLRRPPFLLRQRTVGFSPRYTFLRCRRQPYVFSFSLAVLSANLEGRWACCLQFRCPSGENIGVLVVSGVVVVVGSRWSDDVTRGSVRRGSQHVGVPLFAVGRVAIWVS
ncbi:Uncharacterized protein Rs2_37542 [Raphanus sativus]|nr:Uncharacterized protein Rs2_37542 [Raphanus sativus]